MEEMKEFSNVVLYLKGGFGVSTTACKVLKITTGVKYAQYDNATRVEYVEKGKRKPVGCMLTYDPWARVMAEKDAVNPEDPLVKDGQFSRSRYGSFDPRYTTDFEDRIVGVPTLYSVGEGKRANCERCAGRVATTEEGGMKVCPPCAGAIREEAAREVTA